jgi:hypothetical protein
MASLTRKLKAKRRERRNAQGRKRKNRLAHRSTPTYAELFAGFGACGKPLPQKKTAPKGKNDNAQAD